MSQQITCPHCLESFDLSEILTKDIEKHLKKGLEKELKDKQEKFAASVALFEEKKKKENELFIERLEGEKNKMQSEIKKQIENEQEDKMKLIQQKLEQEQAKSKALQRMEVEKMELEKLLRDKDEEMSIALRKESLRLEEEIKEKLTKDILSKEREKSDFEIKKLLKQLDDQKKLNEESQRKLEQGSMQTQGEIQELALEELLRTCFPFDEVLEVPKGRKGADCILVIKNTTGQFAGRIVFESKRTKEFKNEWIDKLKEDTLANQGEISVLVSQILPKDVQMFDMYQGVWVCRLKEVPSLVKSLREGILKVARAKQNQENKGDKKEMLYNYFTSNEFRQQVDTINSAYLSLKAGIDKERFQMEKIWKEREKQIDKVLLNSHHLIGSIEGITGIDAPDQNTLES